MIRRLLALAAVALCLAPLPLLAQPPVLSTAGSGQLPCFRVQQADGRTGCAPLNVHITPNADGTWSFAGGTASPLSTAGQLATITGTFTTPAGTTAYAIGDLIANAPSAASVVPVTMAAARANDATIMLRRARVKTTDTGFAGASIRLHVYKNSPTASNGDNGAWLTTESIEVCEIDVTLNRHFTDAEKGIGVPIEGAECNIEPSVGTKNVFVLVEARSAATPQGAKPWTIVFEVWQN